MNQQELRYIMSDFCEENWTAFILHCEERDFTEEEVEEALEVYKQGVTE